MKYVVRLGFIERCYVERDYIIEADTPWQAEAFALDRESIVDARPRSLLHAGRHGGFEDRRQRPAGGMGAMPFETIDMAFTSHGSIVSIRPLTDAARDWIDDNVAVEGREWLGGALSTEPRCAFDILEAMQADGLVCT